MQTIIIQTISGSIIVLFIIAFRNFIEERELYKWKFFLLKSVIFFYLVPLSPLKFSGYLVLSKFAVGKAERKQNVYLSNESNSVLMIDKKILINSVYETYLLVLVIVLFISFIMLLKYIKRYLKLKKDLVNCIYLAETDTYKEYLVKLKKEIGLNKEIKLLINNLETGALTTGYRHPIIVMPAHLQGDQIEVVLLHELYHIKRKDLLIKFITFLVVCVHWFNPLVYLIPQMINDACEIGCDDMVLKKLSLAKRKVYAKEILKQAMKNFEEPSKEVMRFSKGNSLTKRRIYNIMKENNKKRKMGIATFFLSSITLSTAVLPVYAYDVPAMLKVETEGIAVQEEIINFDELDIAFSDQNEEIYNIQYDIQFIDGNGNIYDATANQRGRCAHSTVVDGNVQTHKENGDGSCYVKTFDGARCTECGTVIWGELISESYFPTCIH